MISVSIISNEFSNLLTSQMSVRYSYEKVPDVKSLSSSKIEVISTYHSDYLGYNNILLDQKILQNTIINLNKFIDEDKWMRGLFDRDYAIIMYEVPFKSVLSQFYEKYSPNETFVVQKVTKIKDFSRSSLTVLAINKRMEINFSNQLKLR